MAKQFLPDSGILNEVLLDLAGPPPSAPESRIACVACGVRIHFPWDKACARAAKAVEELRMAAAGLPVEIISAPEPFEDPGLLTAFLDAQLAKGLDGIVFFHAAYTAGEIGSCLGRWLCDHPTPLLSWAWPESGTGGRNEANSLTCQNFLLNMWKQMGIPYAWLHEEISAAAGPGLARFVRVCHARHAFKGARLLHAGGSRVTAFYDGETDELAVMRRFGCRFDRMDLEAVYQHGQSRFPEENLLRLHDALVSHPRCAGVDLPRGQILQTYRLGLAILSLAREHGYLGATVKSWPELFDCYGCAIDGAVSMLNDAGFCVAEEGEMNGLLSSLALWFLSGGAAVPTMMDLSLWRRGEDRLGIWHCGASPTRWLAEGATFRATKHSILENGNPETAVGLMLEFPLAHVPVTALRFQSPAAARWFAFEGEFVGTEMAYRGNYGLMKPAPGKSVGCIMGTILDAGLDHHWSVGAGHWLGDLRMLGHFLGLEEIPMRHEEACFGLSRR